MLRIIDNRGRFFLLAFAIIFILASVYFVYRNEPARELFVSKEGFSFTYSPKLFPFVFDAPPVLLLQSNEKSPAVRIVITIYSATEEKAVSDEKFTFERITHETISKEVRKKIGSLNGTFLEARSREREDYMFLSAEGEDRTVFFNLIFLNTMGESALDKSRTVREFYSIIKSLEI